MYIGHLDMGLDVSQFFWLEDDILASYWVQELRTHDHGVQINLEEATQK